MRVLEAQPSRRDRLPAVRPGELRDHEGERQHGEGERPTNRRCRPRPGSSKRDRCRTEERDTQRRCDKRAVAAGKLREVQGAERRPTRQVEDEAERNGLR